MMVRFPTQKHRATVSQTEKHERQAVVTTSAVVPMFIQHLVLPFKTAAQIQLGVIT